MSTCHCYLVLLSVTQLVKHSWAHSKECWFFSQKFDQNKFYVNWTCTQCWLVYELTKAGVCSKIIMYWKLNLSKTFFFRIIKPKQTVMIFGQIFWEKSTFYGLSYTELHKCGHISAAARPISILNLWLSVQCMFLIAWVTVGELRLDNWKIIGRIRKEKAT